MATEYFVKLWDNNIIQLGIWQTIYMTALTTIFAYLIGLPLGVILWATDKDGLHPNKGVNTVLGFIVNFFRSIPAVILMVAMIPAAKLLLGTSTGNGAVIVTLIIAAAPYVARMVESSLKEVPAGVIEAAQAMGCTNFQIIWHVLLPEAKPSLISGSIPRARSRCVKALPSMLQCRVEILILVGSSARINRKCCKGSLYSFSSPACSISNAAGSATKSAIFATLFIST